MYVFLTSYILKKLHSWPWDCFLRAALSLGRWGNIFYSICICAFLIISGNEINLPNGISRLHRNKIISQEALTLLPRAELRAHFSKPLSFEFSQRKSSSWIYCRWERRGKSMLHLWLPFSLIVFASQQKACAILWCLKCNNHDLYMDPFLTAAILNKEPNQEVLSF